MTPRDVIGRIPDSYALLVLDIALKPHQGKDESASGSTEENRLSPLPSAKDLHQSHSRKDECDTGGTLKETIYGPF